MSYEHKKTNGTQNDSLNMENLVKNRKPILRREERFLKDFGNGRGRWIKQLTTIDGSDRAQVDESTSSREDRLIADEGPGYVDEDMLPFDWFVGF